MILQPTRRSGIAPIRGGQPVPRGLCDVTQPVRQDARRVRFAVAA